MVQCKNCIETPHPSIVTFPALSEQCLPLLEALCAAYDIPTQSGFFDPAMLVEQQCSQFICIRSKILFGKTELDEDEMRLLIRTIIRESLRRLVKLMESLKDSLLLGLDNSHSDHRNGASTFHAYKSSVESIMSQLVVLKEALDGESNIVPLA
ncbi:hypothetical protein N7520_005367 [Penicillium odoratum]|uniref:uncharacterized protein n=1 Tax=Penicillium odoratum TaxID=1167516 RepID=UPI002546F24A|nr:uncharacterized protein N7520_005367 [Penicillium odoratum]KAJ5765808.1 hypothetical protein N7520_005367 [Penicillium odoratum]